MKSLFLLPWVLAVATASAQDAVVTTLADSGGGSLREALDGRGGRITFAPFLAGGTVLMAAGSIPYTINNNAKRDGYTIDASTLPGGIPINANTSAGIRRRIFQLGVMNSSDVGLVLKGLTLTGGWAPSGSKTPAHLQAPHSTVSMPCSRTDCGVRAIREWSLWPERALIGFTRLKASVENLGWM